MSEPRLPKPAKLVIGMFARKARMFQRVARELEAAFGSTDLVSEQMAFDFTDYYETEMGCDLSRRLLTFRELIAQKRLSAIKQETNRIESTHAEGGKRRINIDPGYLLSERFVLASGKNFTHRIYIGRGIYADLTLVYQDGEFRQLPWTYPDYADISMRRFLEKVRRKYQRDLKSRRTSVSFHDPISK
jgi:hypothetical protein